MVRQRKRHLTYHFEIDRSKKVTIKSENIIRTLLYYMRNFYGDFGAAITLQSMHIRYFSSETNTFAISVFFGVHRLVMNCFALIKTMDDSPVAFHILHVGGSLKSCLRYLKVKHSKEIKELLKLIKDPQKRNSLNNDIEKIESL